MFCIDPNIHTVKISVFYFQITCTSRAMPDLQQKIAIKNNILISALPDFHVCSSEWGDKLIIGRPCTRHITMMKASKPIWKWVTENRPQYSRYQNETMQKLRQVFHCWQIQPGVLFAPRTGFFQALHRNRPHTCVWQKDDRRHFGLRSVSEIL